MPDKSLIITGITGSPHANATSFQKGQSGNPAGRPRGSGRFREGMRMAAALLDAHAEFIAEQAIELVRAGDAVAVRFCLGRILGARRGQPVELDLPPVAAPGDLAGAVGAITAALAEGRLTPDEALACAQTLDGLPRLFAAIPPPKPAPSEDPRRTLARKLARLAASQEQEEKEAAEAVEQRQAAALASIPQGAH